MVTESCRECAVPCRVVVMLVNGDLCLHKGDKLCGDKVDGIKH